MLFTNLCFFIILIEDCIKPVKNYKLAGWFSIANKFAALLKAIFELIDLFGLYHGTDAFFCSFFVGENLLFLSFSVGETFIDELLQQAQFVFDIISCLINFWGLFFRFRYDIFLLNGFKLTLCVGRSLILFAKFNLFIVFRDDPHLQSLFADVLTWLDPYRVYSSLLLLAEF